MINAIDIQQILVVGSILFSATIVVRLAGFGGSLFAMPLIVPILSLPVSSAIMNLFGITNFGIVLAKQRHALAFRHIWRIILGSALFVPLGVYLVTIVAESALRIFLGIICIGYALYNLLNLKKPHLKSLSWQWLTGTWAGLFGGAFNVSGVPVIIYADTQNWEPEQFRLNMFSFFLVNSCVGLTSRYVAQQLTSQVFIIWGATIPFMLLGLYIGGYLTQFVNKAQFRHIVLILLLILGSRLIFTAVNM